TCNPGFMQPVSITYTKTRPRGPLDPSGKSDWPLRDFLNMGPMPTSLDDSKAHYDDRVASVVYHAACVDPLPYNYYRQEEGARPIALAKLAYADYFENDHCPGRDITNRQEVFDWLLQQWPHKGQVLGTSIDASTANTLKVVGVLVT